MRFLALLFCALLLTACATQQTSVKPIRIGVLASTSGPAAVYGNAFMVGVNKALDEINANGTRIEVIPEDNKNDPKEGVLAYQRMRLEDPDIIVSSMSGATVSIAPLVKEDGKPMIGTLTVAPFQKDYDNSYRYFFSASDIGNALVDFCKAHNITRIGIYVTNSEAGLTVVNAAKEKLAAAGITVVAQEAYDPATTDHKTGLLKVTSQDPQAIYVWAIRPDQVVADIKSSYTGPILFNEVVSISRFYLTDDRFEGTYVMAMPFATPGQNAKFNSLFGEQQNGYAAFGYDTMHMIDDALKNGTLATLPVAFGQRSNTGIVGAIQTEGARETHVPMKLLLVQNKTLVAP